MGNLYTIFPFKNIFKIWKNPLYAYAYTKSQKINLLTGARENSNCSEIKDLLEEVKINQNFQQPRVFHVLYEYGYILLDQVEKLAHDTWLIIDILYAEEEIINELKSEKPAKFKFKKLESPSYKYYSEKFKLGYKHLLDGNCYQFNLTFSFVYAMSQLISSPQEIYKKLWQKKNNRAAYGHCTYIEKFNLMYLSNSPECLFQIIRKNEYFELWSMPIKGTVERDDKNEHLVAEFKKSPKNQAELYMITDLLRNDLSSIEKPIAKVVIKKGILKIPNIIHLFSAILVKLSYQVTLYQILLSLFPGGSITGAPKKRVVNILRELEDGERGLYCGSTIFLYKELLAASINIRSAEIDLKENKWHYHAGGGITLMSRKHEEFKEMHLKKKSFFNILES